MRPRSQRSRCATSAETVSGASVSACASGAKRIRQPARRNFIVRSASSPTSTSCPPTCSSAARRNAPKAPDTIERIPSESWTMRPSAMPIAYSMAWWRVMRLADALRTPRLPLTAPTRGSAKYPSSSANALRSKVVSTSEMTTISPVQAERPRLMAALLPPRCSSRYTESILPSRCRSLATSNIRSVEPSSTTITSMGPRVAKIVCSANASMEARRGFSSL